MELAAAGVGISPASLGFVGTGTLAAALVEAFEQHLSPAPHILLSPRSQARGEALASRFEMVRQAASNHDVVAGAEVVFLGMRPQDFSSAMDGLGFRAGQIVVSLLAAAPLARVSAMVGDAVAVRLFSTPAIATGPAPLVIFPHNATVSALLAPLGPVVSMEQEAHFDAIFTAAGFMSTWLEMHNTIAGQLIARGLRATDAHKFVNLMVAGLLRASEAAEGQPAETLIVAHETPGGLNARCRRWLRETGWFGQFEAVFGRLEQDISR